VRIKSSIFFSLLLSPLYLVSPALVGNQERTLLPISTNSSSMWVGKSNRLEKSNPLLNKRDLIKNFQDESSRTNNKIIKADNWALMPELRANASGL
jgi:hypothetical protein